MATLTISTTSAEDARIAAAFGAYLDLGRNATGAEVKGAIIRFVKDTVRDQEAIAAQSAITLSPDVAPT